MWCGRHRAAIWAQARRVNISRSMTIRRRLTICGMCVGLRLDVHDRSHGNSHARFRRQLLHDQLNDTRHHPSRRRAQSAPARTAHEGILRAQFRSRAQQPQAIACKRYPVAKLLHLLPSKYLTQLETNEKLEACCRRPIEHDIEAFYSPLGERENVPDIYIMHCTCGRKHRRFCVGGGDQRPMWDSR
jgi:hypothetical protein